VDVDSGKLEIPRTKSAAGVKPPRRKTIHAREIVGKKSTVGSEKNTTRSPEKLAGKSKNQAVDQPTKKHAPAKTANPGRRKTICSNSTSKNPQKSEKLQENPVKITPALRPTTRSMTINARKEKAKEIPGQSKGQDQGTLKKPPAKIARRMTICAAKASSAKPPENQKPKTPQKIARKGVKMSRRVTRSMTIDARNKKIQQKNEDFCEI
jgi:hypothetical protein